MVMGKEHVMRARALRVAAVVLVTMAASVAAAEAQAPRVELSGGYQYTSVPDFNFAAGWFGDVTANISDVLGIVGEISGAHTTQTEQITSRQSVDVNVSLLTFMGGIRATAHGNRRLVPYMQTLAGAARGSASTDVQAAGFDIAVSETRPALQIGGGVIWMLTPKAGIRAGVDYRAVYFDGGQENEYRVATSAVFAFGK
jgi:hypothetical protein